MSNTAQPVNPYLQRRPFGSAHNKVNNVEMGRQSQQRVNQTKRVFQCAQIGNSKKKKGQGEGNQLTLDGQ